LQLLRLRSKPLPQPVQPWSLLVLALVLQLKSATHNAELIELTQIGK